ncbi:DHA2 family efflux MFS transporter permease subunit [Deinococcus metallilatus]|uniref:DHA2 family efflux MFS transporter permease subunit n=1 Tax=Deinococcus metallilatus TaxID=1211322 RepID=A0AAJ5JYP3_9DEIO|nr:DHA2 family efflux MFS transporter permease subunit [Deinococcus metallilatus]MBB5294771.1 EmrB/QacA subfamily drug resistance transporter [Deinococcus metallilatus]QBY09505.1 DHA2 family efflux MFS transporter permease subunit [Deinococcus metallilatus]RXJ09510.1 DHA2 family efflux MFS transporter permease subunit [Deinococcus metallilatus]TLK29032.1 DHA2 family efflux MFS transporter permease subunit [Deinococcus metallilatus]GMA16697.1 MFS transporter [Deinococcus metallilatus]
MTAPTQTAPFNFTEQEKRTTLIGLLVVFLLAALSQTIVSTAMPRIIADLQGFNLYSWVTTAYLLASTVMVPIYGKLSDLYGRKPILVFGIVVFLLGSALSGLAGEPFLGNFLGGGMNQLIAFRAVAGFGGAALFTMAFAILADMFPPAQRAKFGGLFGAIFGLASVIGPAVGGFLTDQLSWRWTFYVNLPLGLLALFLILARMPRLTHRSEGKIDYPGAALILSTTIPLLLALTWGGTTYPWDSARIITLFAVSAVSLIAFLFVESRTRDAIIPLSLFRIRMFSLGNLAAFIMGMAFLGVILFLPLYMQMVLGVSPTNSGFSMLPLMGGLILSSILSGNIVGRTGQYKPWMIGGGLVLMLGVYLLTQITTSTSIADLGWRMFVVGLGLGPAQSLFTLAIQNAVPMTQMGIATSSSQFFRQIGSTIGAALFGTLLLNNLHAELPRHLPQIPGMQMNANNFDLGALRASSSGSGNGPEQKIRAAFDAQYAQIEKALNGDQTSARALAANPVVPAELKALVANGGLQAQVHQKLTAQAAQIGNVLKNGEAGRQALLNSDVPEALKTQLRALPAQALATPQAAAVTAQRVQQGILAQEPTAVKQATQTTLAQIKTKLNEQARTLAAQLTSGMKEGFTVAMTRMFGTSIWIILAGFLVTLFVPAIPLRGRAERVNSAPPAQTQPGD